MDFDTPQRAAQARERLQGHKFSDLEPGLSALSLPSSPNASDIHFSKRSDQRGKRNRESFDDHPSAQRLFFFFPLPSSSSYLGKSLCPVQDCLLLLLLLLLHTRRMHLRIQLGSIRTMLAFLRPSLLDCLPPTHTCNIRRCLSMRLRLYTSRYR